MALSSFSFSQHINKDDISCFNDAGIMQCKSVKKIEGKKTNENSIIFKSVNNGIVAYSDTAPQGEHEALDLSSDKMKERLSVYPAKDLNIQTEYKLK